MVYFSVSGVKAQSRIPAFPDTAPSPTVRFYPNPANSFITFDDFNKKYDRTFTIQIFNFCGKKVLEFNLGDQKNMVNLSDFFRGIYIFQLRDPSGKIVESGKFQVNK